MKTLNNLKKIYEKNLKNFGDNHKSVGWKKKSEALARYKVMTNLFKNDYSVKRILDVGCGLSHYFLFLKKNISNFKYIGLDISEKMINLSAIKYPNNSYFIGDAMNDNIIFPKFDYAIINGLFTQKANYSDKIMFFFFKNVLGKIFFLSKKGIALNLLTPFPEWKNKKNYYPQFEIIIKFITKNLSNKFIINHNYGLHEYTIYVYK